MAIIGARYLLWKILNNPKNLAYAAPILQIIDYLEKVVGGRKKKKQNRQKT